MRSASVVVVTVLALLAFAANSLLCRLALRSGGIDAATFTTLRLVAGAATLWLLVALRGGGAWRAGSWRSALALFAYAAAFSFAYLGLTAATGALLLFGAVQATMLAHGLFHGERLRGARLFGFALAVAGLAGLLLPGLSAPPPVAAALMLGAGVAWGVYSLRGRGAADPVRGTAGNFLRTLPFALGLLALAWPVQAPQATGLACAIASGALASGLGYVLWYAALPRLTATTAATVQLAVPPLAALGGIAFLAEPPTLRLALASAAILGGIALVVRMPRRGARD